jgi:hypothetical protein
VNKEKMTPAMLDAAGYVHKRIKDVFPFIDVNIYPFTLDDESIVVEVDYDVYHSQEYLSLVSDIHLNYLYKNNIDNFLFVGNWKDEIEAHKALVGESFENLAVSSL